MSESVNDYYQLVQEPWGRMFYDLVWEQADIEDNQRYTILDYGSGFGVTSRHYSYSHNVIAIEPNDLMLEKRFAGSYEQLAGGEDKLKAFPDNFFDVIFCHNVLEYCRNQAEIFNELTRVLKNNGRISLVKHNKDGKVLHTAVFKADPAEAMSLFEDAKSDSSKTFGERYLYDEADMLDWLEGTNMEIYKKYGVRTFFSLIHDNAIKYDPVWYSGMLKLEREVSEVEPYRSIAFFHHYILVKK